MNSLLLMSTENRFRLVQFSRVREGHISPADAAASVGIGNRQFRRAYKAWIKQGDASLVHGLRGKPSNNKGDVEVREKSVALYRQKYKGYGPLIASQFLQKKDGLTVNASTLVRWLAAAGEWVVGQRKAPPVHRHRREPKPSFGMMVQMDGSRHDWFNGRNPAMPMLNLMVMVDDATGIAHARFSTVEDAHSIYSVFREWCLKHGVPLSLYVDKAGTYLYNGEITVEMEVAGRIPETQFARSMREMSVEIICAHSPQAKGRVERMNGTLQDRLVKELEQAGISDIEKANAFLDAVFLPEFNGMFARPAARPDDAHREVAQCLPVGKTLDDVLAFEETRVVGKDWCVQFNNRVFQISAKHRSLHLPRREVVVREKLDGSLVLARGKGVLDFEELAAKPVAQPIAFEKRMADHAPPWKPAGSHPWRKDAVGKAKKLTA